MVEFSSLVWIIHLLLFLGVVTSFTLNHNERTTKLNMSLAIVSFLLSLCVIIERHLVNNQDYGYYLDWFVLDNFYYRIGYELNHTSSYFIVVITGLNVVLHVVNKQYKNEINYSSYAYLNLIFGLLTGIVISDNVLTYYIVSVCIGVALFLKLAYMNVSGMIHTLRTFSKTFIVGHLLFLCALMLIFYHQPNHAVEFTIIDSSLSMQPDLLNMDDEWIIGLLLVLSTIFTSTVLVPFEKQLRQQSLIHMVTIYVLTSFRIILPAYMLIRFESLIRLDTRTETVVILLGVALLFMTCFKLLLQRSVAELLLNMSNAMLGMLYIMFGLQAKLMLSALVVVCLGVYLLTILLITFSSKEKLFLATKVTMSVILLLPFVMCISSSKHYSLNISNSVTVLNVVTWTGIVTYSLIIFASLFGLKRYKFAESNSVFKQEIFSRFFIIITSIIMIGIVGLSWYEEFILEERNKFSVTLSEQLWVNIFIICIYIAVGLTLSLLLKFKQKYQIHRKISMTINKWPLLSYIKTAIVFVAHQLEVIWDYIWDKVIPYPFKKIEVVVSSRQPKFVRKLVSIWMIAVVISIALVIIRG